MWQQNYTPIADSVGASAATAALPIVALLLLLGIFRKPAWMAALAGLASASILAVAVYGMPVPALIGAITYGAAIGIFPIGWVVFWAVVLYRITVETGNFEIVKDSVGSLTTDRRLQALLIAFAFGAFIEGAAGFGTPVAVAAAMLTGLGFKPFYAAGICLLANTAPVAFGSIGTPLLMLETITRLPLLDLSANVGRICAPVSLIVPAYLVLVIGGLPALRGVFPAAALCGISFAGVQFLVSNYIGPQLTDILSSLAAMASLVLLFKFWKPKDAAQYSVEVVLRKHTTQEVLRAWMPYGLLVIFVLLLGLDAIKAALGWATMSFPWPGLHNVIERIPPAVRAAGPYPALFSFNFLTASGTACMVASFLSALFLGMGFGKFLQTVGATARQLALSMVTIMSVLALSFLMNYAGATATLGLAFAATGALFPFFSAMLGWLGVFLTGSDTSANALFGNLQVVTAERLGFNPLLMAASNSSGGVMGKMISLQSIAVAAAATGMAAEDEAKLFRFTFFHSVLLAVVLGLIVVLYAYVFPTWVR
ncbi:MAG TPA: lactate permease LctP family transporter [Bryobacteraceae bacterium]|nr:lactate permease LctP family transporter [Bryobacteraceae bacterium]